MTFGSNVTAGSMLFVAAWIRSATALVEIRDSLNNPWTCLGYQLEPGSGRRSAAWYAPNVAGGATTLTCVTQGGVASDFCAAEYSGISSVSPLDTWAMQGTAGTSALTPTITTTVPNAAILAWVVTFDSASSVASPFTMRANGVFDFDSNGFADQIVSATGSYQATFTTSGTGNVVTGIAAFADSAVSGPRTSRRLIKKTYAAGFAGPF